MTEEIDEATKHAIDGIVDDIAHLMNVEYTDAAKVVVLYLSGRAELIGDRIRSIIEQHIKDLADSIGKSVEETKQIVLRYLAKRLLKSIAVSEVPSESELRREALELLEKRRSEIYEWYSSARSCIEEEVSILDLLPWSRQLLDTANIWLSFHRSTILGDLIRKLPEATRSRSLPVMMGSRFELSPFTYVSESCMKLIIRFLSEASRITLNAAARMGVNRYVVGAARIISILSRAATSDGFYLDRRSLLGLLYELYINISALV